jgi:hypothetical protein
MWLRNLKSILSQITITRDEVFDILSLTLRGGFNFFFLVVKAVPEKEMKCILF